jgi:CorA-like Mg2+ transporter protein
LKSRDESYQPPRPNTDKDEDRENEEDEWLRDSDDGRSTRRPDSNPVFVNRLLNISKETKLLVECKDIEDELVILYTVIEQQHDILKTMADTLKIPRRRAGLQVRLVSQHLLDIQRMQRSANGVSKSLTQLLDLKQKHANAIEARFARDQAEDTARQGQTIMVFTIVTIVFLPLSFMAAFFAINIVEFPHDAANGGSGLPLRWVSKYLFGIGFAVSVPMIAVAFVFADTLRSRWQLKRWWTTTNWGRQQKKHHGSRNTTASTSVTQHHVAQKISRDLADGHNHNNNDAQSSAKDSERYLFPRRTTTRVETGFTAETMDSEV